MSDVLVFTIYCLLVADQSGIGGNIIIGQIPYIYTTTQPGTQQDEI